MIASGAEPSTTASHGCLSGGGAARVPVRSRGCAAAQPFQSPELVTLPQKDVTDFDHFLDRHPEINGPVQKDPMLLGSPKFLKAHPPLAEFYDGHPALSTYVLELAGSPDAPQRKVK